jgi:hypothetical protein
MTWQPELTFAGPPPNWDYPEGSKTKAQRLAALQYATNVAEADEAEELHSKPSQRDAILRHLKENPYHPITHLEAQHLFGCSRLAARVQELRRMGHDVKSRMVETPSGKRVAEYWL